MFGLSDAELQMLEELWKLIQSERTTQIILSDDVSSEPLSTTPMGFDDPLIERDGDSPAKVSQSLFSD